MKVALLGNPNSGKSSLFNHLTGLRQKIGNFPGVTVDKKLGFCKLNQETEIEVLDLPGTYSLYPNSLDEQVVLDVLTNPKNPDYPDLAVIVVDASNIKRNMLLFEQVSDLNISTILVLNMLDIANEAGISIDTGKLSKLLGVPVLEMNSREGIGVEGLKLKIFQQTGKQDFHKSPSIINEELKKPILEIKQRFGITNDYLASHYLTQSNHLSFLSKDELNDIDLIVSKNNFDSEAFQSNEIIARYKDIALNLEEVIEYQNTESKVSITDKLDKILLHKFWGYLIFLSVLFIIFQSVFVLASYPMDWIDAGVAYLNDILKANLPDSQLTNLLTDGLIAGIGGVVIFIPQIAFLFALISLLEESGYMARVVVLMDKLIRKFGMSGKSVVPLISSMACAVPAIMSARTIGNWKDRLITIMVTPLMSCSARLPIYTILISLVVPNDKFLGFFGLQGIVLMALYLLGFVSALLSGWVITKFLKSTEKSYFVMELPTYKSPRWTQVMFTIIEKVKTFVFEAGKVIVAISIILWVLASYGPGDSIKNAEEATRVQNVNLTEAELETKIASSKLQHSYAGIFGKFIEPAIKPLGYDWKIGIALITSFAAREVFVGTVSTIYSIGNSNEDEHTIMSMLKKELNPETGKPIFNVATSFSLLIFYVFAMMCMSTLAVVYRETKGWKWPLIQLIYMSILAYGSAFITFQLLS
jgi:ferrous iron transport protein B